MRSICSLALGSSVMSTIASVSSVIPQNSDKPNLIMILVDEHNFRTLGCYRDLLPHDQAFPWGDGVKVDTPHIDSLSQNGTLFQNYYTVAPLCTPSRASFMTGMYPEDTGATKNHEMLNSDMTTFAEILNRDHDYYTGYFGKWHLNGDEKPGWNAGGDRKFGFIETKFQYNRGHWKFFDREKGEVMGYEWSEKEIFRGRHDEHYATDFFFDRGIDFIDRQLDEDRHFAMVISIPDPHAPNIVRLPYNDMYVKTHFQLPYTAKVAVKGEPSVPRWQYTDGDIVPEAEEYLEAYEQNEFWQNHLQKYFAMVKCIDDNVGKLLSYLKDKDVIEDTIIVFTADHGDQLGEHGKLNKGKPYEASAGIPHLIHYPRKLQGGNVIETPYSSIDFAPTILGLMGINARKSNPNMYGLDGSAELLGEEPAKKGQIRFMYDAGKKARWAAALNGRFKLIISRNEVPWLFDLTEDPDEIYNYYDFPQYFDIQDDLQKALLNEIEKHNLPIFRNEVIYWNTPTCIDSNDVIPTELKGYCEELDEETIQERCKYKKVYNHCPVTCNKCCEDSPGKLVLNKQLKGCSDLTDYCSEKAKVRKFCMRSCGLC